MVCWPDQSGVRQGLTLEDVYVTFENGHVTLESVRIILEEAEDIGEIKKILALRAINCLPVDIYKDAQKF